ncbi:MAG: DNA modification methylase [Thermoleophilia bacterium]
MKTIDEDELTVTLWPIDRPIPYARNPRSVPEVAIAKVAASLQEFGFRQPIVVDEDGVVIVGHTRLLAAQRLGMNEVPVHVATGLSPQQVKAYRIADNRTAMETSWDAELLPLELSELLGLGVDLEVTGFDPRELAALLSNPTEGLTGEDEVPEAPEEPVTNAGDLWLLGEHRLLCGDSTNPDDVQRVMGGKRAALMATDPPYLVDYDGGNHPQTWGKDGQAISSEEKTKHWDSYTDHESAVTFYADFLRTAIEHALTDEPFLYQFFGMMKVDIVLEAWRSVGLLPHQIIIWKKSRPVLTRCDYMYDFEPFMYGWKQGDRPRSGTRPPANATAVWEVASAIEDGAGGIHPTQKPVELIRRPITYHTLPGDLIYEPFSGSGTALIAAESTGRVCYAIEQSPQFVEVAVERWQNFTGKVAERVQARQ